MCPTYAPDTIEHQSSYLEPQITHLILVSEYFFPYQSEYNMKNFLVFAGLVCITSRFRPETLSKKMFFHAQDQFQLEVGLLIGENAHVSDEERHLLIFSTTFNSQTVYYALLFMSPLKKQSKHFHIMYTLR